jgi:hypothetical protein
MLANSMSCVTEYSSCGVVSLSIRFILFLATEDCDFIIIQLPMLPDFFIA